MHRFVYKHEHAILCIAQLGRLVRGIPTDFLESNKRRHKGRLLCKSDVTSGPIFTDILCLNFRL